MGTCCVSGGGGGSGDAAALTAMVGWDRAALEAMLDLIRLAAQSFWLLASVDFS